MPAVVLFSNDLTVLSRVEGAASHLGKTVRSVSTSAQLADCGDDGAPGLLIIDLSSPSLEIDKLVAQWKLQEPAATRIVAFGPHVHEERLAAARQAGCDVVVSRGQFFSQIDSILGQ
jgi:DNA-binding response OmpR family regulator